MLEMILRQYTTILQVSYGCDTAEAVAAKLMKPQQELLVYDYELE